MWQGPYQVPTRGIGFTRIPSSTWWPRYLSLGVTLVTAQSRDLDDLVGRDRSGTVEKPLEQTAETFRTGMRHRLPARNSSWLSNRRGE